LLKTKVKIYTCTRLALSAFPLCVLARGHIPPAVQSTHQHVCRFLSPAIVSLQLWSEKKAAEAAFNLSPIQKY
jgi:hypothetical protein